MTADAPDRTAQTAISSEEPVGGWRSRWSTVRVYVGRGRSPLWVELLIVVWLCWIYDAVNNLSPVRASLAHANAGAILHFEQSLHLDPERTLDHWMAGHPTLASVVSNYYDNAHFVVTLAALGVLWWKRADLYRPLRNNLVITNVAAMVVFWLVPVAPPRLYDPRTYVDVVASTHAFGSWHAGSLATAANQLAAMPSLHISWAAWSALVVWRMLPKRWWRALVWIYPAITSVAVLTTGNHFLADVVAGAVLTALATIVADGWGGWWTSRQARLALQNGELDEPLRIEAEPVEATPLAP